jgi:hypothetical protein
MRTLKYKYFLWREKHTKDIKLKRYYHKKAKKALYK